MIKRTKNEILKNKATTLLLLQEDDEKQPLNQEENEIQPQELGEQSLDNITDDNNHKQKKKSKKSKHHDVNTVTIEPDATSLAEDNEDMSSSSSNELATALVIQPKED